MIYAHISCLYSLIRVFSIPKKDASALPHVEIGVVGGTGVYGVEGLTERKEVPVLRLSDRFLIAVSSKLRLHSDYPLLLLLLEN